jgi:hypothetical protein
MTTPLTDSGVASRIGRHFDLVSMLPASLFVLYVAWLLGSGAWTGPFDPRSGVSAVSSVGIAGGALLFTLALALAVVVHPLLFGATQLLEGYWGGRLGLRLVEWRTGHHRRRAQALEKATNEYEEAWEKAALGGYDRKTREKREAAGATAGDLARHYVDLPDGDALVPVYLRYVATQRALRDYPTDFHRIMPTRLGNVLRRFEDQAGSQYGLQAIPIAPRLSSVAAADNRNYLEDAGQQLDLAVRVCSLSLVATVLTAVLLADDGLWVLLAFLPYASAYFGYRGAVAAGRSQGVAFATVLDLERFTLYERLHLEPPADTVAERAQNRQLMDLVKGSTSANLAYKSDPPAPKDAESLSWPERVGRALRRLLPP